MANNMVFAFKESVNLIPTKKFELKLFCNNFLVNYLGFVDNQEVEK